MREYRITECKHGFLVQQKPEEMYYTGEMWAFSTLKEVQDYLPKLFGEEVTIKPQEVE
jgi:hypothetical protein